MKVIKYTLGDLETNTYLIINNDNDCIIIDPALGMEEVSNIIKEKYNVKAILLTHAHLDHIDGIRYFLNVPIYLSKDEYDILKDDNYNLYQEFYGDNIPFDINKLDIRFVSDNENFDLIGLAIEVTTTPGHTKGGVCYRIEDSLFTGDTLFSLSVGRWDFPSGNYCLLASSIKKLINKYDNIMCYPGHGDAENMNYIKKYNELVLEMLK